MEYKKIYAPEEIKELLDWFQARLADLPGSLRLDQATFIPDFPATARSFMAIAEQHRENATYGAQIYMLFRMRDKLLADGTFPA